MSDQSIAESVDSPAEEAAELPPGIPAGSKIGETGELPLAIRISEVLRKFVDAVGRFGSWWFLPMVFITVMDVVLRKIGVQYWLITTFGRVFDSTILQEAEWHAHTVLFALVLGYGYIWNTHVRVDLVRETLSLRKKAWLEFIGLTFFLIPFMAVVTWFAFEYAYDAYVNNEISVSTVGLTHRWIIKSVLVAGFVVVLVSGIAVWLQVVILLWGPKDLRFPLMTLEWPEEAGTMIEGKVRLKLEDMEDQVADKSAQFRKEAAGASEKKTE